MQSATRTKLILYLGSLKPERDCKFQQEVVNFVRNFSKTLRNYQMNSSTLANEIINIFWNTSIGMAVIYRVFFFSEFSHIEHEMITQWNSNLALVQKK